MIRSLMRSKYVLIFSFLIFISSFAFPRTLEIKYFLDMERKKPIQWGCIDAVAFQRIHGGSTSTIPEVYLLDTGYDAIYYNIGMESLGYYYDEKRLPDPEDIAIWQGHVYVADGKKGIVELKRMGDRLLYWRDVISGLRLPTKLTIDGEGNFLVHDLNALKKFDRNGRLLFSLGMEDLLDLAVDGKENIWVLALSDSKENRRYLLEFSPTGELLKKLAILPGTWKGSGTVQWTSLSTANIVIDKYDNIYVSDRVEGKIYKYSPDLTLLSVVTQKDADEYRNKAVDLNLLVRKNVEYLRKGKLWKFFGRDNVLDEYLWRLRLWMGYLGKCERERDGFFDGIMEMAYEPSTGGLFIVEENGLEYAEIGVDITNVKDKVIVSKDKKWKSKLSFTLTDPASVTVELYDKNRRTVNRWCSGRVMGVGDRKIEFDGRDIEGQDLPPGEYEFKIKAYSTYSTDRTAEVRKDMIVLPMIPPELIYPKNGSSVKKGDVFRWKGVDLAKKYILQYSDDKDFSEKKTFTVETTNTMYEMPEILFKSKKRWYWRVKAVSGDVESEYSDISSFDTSLPPLDITDLIAYPNPTRKDWIRFRYVLSRPANVEAKVYTLMGKFVANITNGEVENSDGVNELEWKLKNERNEDVVNGIYILWLKAETESEVITKTMRFGILR